MRLGLFGGTFDPPHVGHLIVAQDALEGFALDRIVFVPAAQPPHKQDRTITPGPIRLEMLRAAVVDNPCFSVDPIELERAGPSWTVDTVRAFRDRHPDAQLVLLMGADQWAEMETWRSPEEILAMAEVGVLGRGSAQAPGRRVDVSSTEIRARVRTGLPVRYMVPEGVLVVMRREGLYA